MSCFCLALFSSEMLFLLYICSKNKKQYQSENVRVQSDADFLELGAVNRVLIKSSFVVEKGAELIIDKVVYNEEEDSFER